ncbi:MAG: methyltransferase domain-containing protein [Pseudomonadota bacterium]
MNSMPTADRGLVRIRLARAIRRGNRDALFLRRIAIDDLIDRLTMVRREFETGVDLSGWTSDLTDRLRSEGMAKRVHRLAPFVADARPAAIIDDEVPPLRSESVDLVLSVLALQFTNDLPGVLAQIRRVLKPDGLFMAALIGGDTLHELRACLTDAEAELSAGLSPRVTPSAEIKSLGVLLQRAGFALPVADQERLTIRYADLKALIGDLRAMAATNFLSARNRAIPVRSLFSRASEMYAERYADPDGRIRATFDIIWLSGWAPHASQQRPLKPGAAKERLADALGTEEVRMRED